jgi:hypothetical protein
VWVVSYMDRGIWVRENVFEEAEATDKLAMGLCTGRSCRRTGGRFGKKRTDRLVGVGRARRSERRGSDRSGVRSERIGDRANDRQRQ